MKKNNPNFKDIHGFKFGILTVLSLEKNTTNKTGAYWKCQCECGKISIVCATRLRSGHTRSCGCLRKSKNPKGLVGLKTLFSQYRHSCKRTDRNFEISLEQFKTLTSGNCFYCGDPPSSYCTVVSGMTNEGSEHTCYIYNGIDRINSDLGYELENCVSCCKICNQMKMDFKQDFFLKKIKQISDFLKL